MTELTQKFSGGNTSKSIGECMTATRRLQRQSHFTQSKEVMSPGVFDTRHMVSMDECKEMIQIEQEFGSIINPEEEKKDNGEGYWPLISNKIRSNKQTFGDFKEIIN